MSARPRLTTRPLGGRRGAVLPLVCVLLTALLAAAALGIDLARMYYAGVEVQTAADAAALAATRYQQYNPTLGMGGVQGAAQEVAALNRSGGAPVQVQAQDVVPVTYDPDTRVAAASGWTRETAAFTVTAQAEVPSAFGGVPRTIRRSATAWLANVNGATCVRPFAINYTRFYEEGVTHDVRYSSTGAFAPEFNLWDIASTKDASLRGRTFIVLPPGADKKWWLDNRQLNSHGNWEPVDFAGGGLYGYGTAVAGPEGSAYCNGNRVAVGDIKRPLIADSASLVTAMNVSMTYLCAFAGDAPNAYCYNSKGTVGVKTRIMLTDSVGAGGAWTHKVREVGVARIMCYFRTANDVCAYQQMSELAATGVWCYYARGDCDGTATGYPPGTLILFLDTPGSTDLTSDIVLGTKPGLTQRLLLAK